MLIKNHQSLCSLVDERSAAVICDVCVSATELDAGGNLSRMSTAPIAVDDTSGIQLPVDDRAIDASRTSVGVDVSAVVADISLPPVPDVAMPAPLDNLSTSIAEPPSVAPADEFADDTAFNETLQSAAADITLFAVRLLIHHTVDRI